jgi:hypothetical protein
MRSPLPDSIMSRLSPKSKTLTKRRRTPIRSCGSPEPAYSARPPSARFHPGDKLDPARTPRQDPLTIGEISLRAGQLKPEYACRPLKNMFTIVKLNITAVKPMIDSHAERDPRQPRVARAWMYPA